MADDSERYRDIVSRRRFVELTGISGVAALAGCLGDGGGGTDSPAETTTEGEATTETEGTATPMGGAAGTATSQMDTTTDGDGTTVGDDTTAGDGTTAGDETTAGDGTTAGNQTGNESLPYEGGTPVEQVYEDAQHIAYENVDTSLIQYNTFNPSNFPQATDELVFDHFAKYNFARDEFIPYGIADWSHNGDSFDMTVREGLTWSNGDAITAEDVAVQLRIGIQQGLAYASYTDSVETTGERSLTVNFTSGVNQRVAEFNLLAQNWLSVPASVFGEYVREGTPTPGTPSGSATASPGVAGFEYTDPLASGPFTVENRGSQQVTMSRRDDHPDADNINFGQYVGRQLGGNTAVHQALRNNTIDSVFSVFASPNVTETFPDNIQQIQTPGLWGMGLIPNHDRPHVGDRAVRKAIQHVINREQVVQNVSPQSKDVPTYPAGIATSVQEQYIGDDSEAFQTYGASSSQTEQATQVLEEAGYSMSGGTWQDPDGGNVRLPVLVPQGWGDWTTGVETVVDQLSNFGFDAVVDARSGSTLQGDVWVNGDFKLAAGGWLAGAPQGVYPYFSLYHQLRRNFRGFQYNYPPAVPERGGSGEDVTVPALSGDDEMTINPGEQLSNLATSTEQQQTDQLIDELAWVTNQDLPMIPVMEKLEQTFITGGDEWAVPEEGAEVSQVRWANTWLPRLGEMQYTGGN